MRRSVILVLLALVACSKRKASPPPQPEPTASATPSAADVDATAPRVDAGWADDPPKAWTDARVVAELAKDCAFTPPPPPLENGRSDLFRCTIAYEQSCVVDPCWEANQYCKGDVCGPACTTCDGACTDRCQACKAPCKDEGCKKDCATTCASCKQDCTRGMDRCASGTCTKIAEDCKTKLTATFGAHRCARPCEVLDACNKKCDRANADSDCYERCRAKIDARHVACTTACGENNRGCALDCIFTSGCSSELCAALR